MHKEVIKYVDYDGNAREEEFWFHLTEAELTQLNLSYVGGMDKRLSRMIQAQNAPELMRVFKDIIRRSYGVKSDDGRRFMKSDELYVDFEQTEAYSVLFMKLCTDSKAASTFINEVIPKSLAEEVAKNTKNTKDSLDNKSLTAPM